MQDLEPKTLWRHFAELVRTPRPSNSEEKAMDFVRQWSESLGFEHCSDSVGNVCVRVPATPGHENAPTVIIQGHVDIVVADAEDAPEDADSARGLIPTQRGSLDDKGRFYEDADGDWICAPYTTLGADNGIGCVAAMAVCEEDDVVHPPLELLFTVDEEVGMSGALKLNPGELNLKGRLLINLDTEDDDELTIGCAGGLDTKLAWQGPREAVDAGQWSCVDVVLKDLRGGHSGVEINSGRANAIRALARGLANAASQLPLRLVSIAGGEKRNAIPRFCSAQVLVAPDKLAALEAVLAETNQLLTAQFEGRDGPLNIRTTTQDGAAADAFSEADSSRLLNLLVALPDGVFTMTAELPELVECSNNVAVVSTQGVSVRVWCNSRSSYEPGIRDVAASLAASAALVGATIEESGAYPGWKPNLDSAILKSTADAYRRLFSEEPKVLAIHAGLECGVLADKMPGLDCISFGPNIRGNHAPGEHVQISSVDKSYRLLVALLADLAGS